MIWFMGFCLLELLMNKLMIYIFIICVGKYKIYIDKFCKFNVLRLKICVIMKFLLIFFLFVMFFIEKILKEGYIIVVKFKIILGY